MVLVAPSREYVAKLPYGKLPNRSDFRKFAGDDEAREKYWKAAIAESERLGQVLAVELDHVRVERVEANRTAGRREVTDNERRPFARIVEYRPIDEAREVATVERVGERGHAEAERRGEG